MMELSGVGQHAAIRRGSLALCGSRTLPSTSQKCLVIGVVTLKKKQQNVLSKGYAKRAIKSGNTIFTATIPLIPNLHLVQCQ